MQQKSISSKSAISIILSLIIHTRPRSINSTSEAAQRAEATKKSRKIPQSSVLESILATISKAPLEKKEVFPPRALMTDVLSAMGLAISLVLPLFIHLLLRKGKSYEKAFNNPVPQKQRHACKHSFQGKHHLYLFDLDRHTLLLATHSSTLARKRKRQHLTHESIHSVFQST